MLDQNLVNNEIERMEILFEKERYNNDQRIWFIEAKMQDAKELNDIHLLEVCNRLMEKYSSK